MHLYPSSPYKEQTCSTYFYTNLQIWHTMNKIRLLTKGELPKAIELSWQVFTITSKEDFNDEGLEFFKSFIYNEKYIDEITFYGSFNNKVEGGNLAASKIRNLECPSYEICLIDYGCGKFNRKIHIMEQYP